MKSESGKQEKKLRPDAPAFVPTINKDVLQSVAKEPQCSRYSRKSVRRFEDAPKSPRPILGTKNCAPRPILGRKDDPNYDEEEDEEKYIGKEFRNIYRKLQRMKINDENKKPKKKTAKI